MLVKKTVEYVKNLLVHHDSGHDYSHIERVMNNAKELQLVHGGKDLIVDLSVLLHDVWDFKFSDKNAGDEVFYYLDGKIANSDRDHIKYIVENISYSKGVKLESLEGKIVQDADRLDALGAIGIMRCFIYSGYNKRSIENAIDHFHDKLFKLQYEMNTDLGRQIAHERTQYMFDFLDQYKLEL